MVNKIKILFMRILKSIIKNNKGITLTETIIYISIVSVVTIILINIMVQFIQLKNNSSSISICSTEVSNVFDKLIYDVRNCGSFSIVNETTLDIVNGGITSRYTLQNGQIAFNNGTNSYFLTTNQVIIQNLKFIDWTSVNSDNLLHIELQIKRGKINENFQTTIHKR